MIEKIGREDIAECVSVIQKSFGTVAEEFGFTRENAPRFTAFAVTEERLNWQLDEGRPMFAYKKDGRIVGYYSLKPEENRECELNNICVLPECRHSKIGSELYAHALKTAGELGFVKMNIVIVEENKRARGWYEKLGAKHIGTEKLDFFPFTCGYMVAEVPKMIFDNHDERIKYYELMLERDLDGLPRYELPEGYRFAHYKDGDSKDWINIEITAKELRDTVQGAEVWQKYYGGHESELPHRMVFIENEQGEKVATATAFYDVFGRDKSGDGWLHWVAVRRDHQGRGLSKPLISHTLEVMRSLGYTHAKIPTQTTSWVAVKVYLDFGFVPIPQNAVNSKVGWEIVNALTNHPALKDFRKADMTEILDTKNLMNEER